MGRVTGQPGLLRRWPFRLVAVAGGTTTLRAVKNFKRLVILGALVALAVVLARKIRET